MPQCEYLYSCEGFSEEELLYGDRKKVTIRTRLGCKVKIRFSACRDRLAVTCFP